MASKYGFRVPKVKQERIALDDPDLELFDIKVRPKRNRKNLPDAYDDCQREITKDWKRHRQTQYHG